MLLVQAHSLQDDVVHHATVLSTVPCVSPSFLLFLSSLCNLHLLLCSRNSAINSVYLALFLLSGWKYSACPCQKAQCIMLKLYVKGKLWILGWITTVAFCSVLHHGEKPPSSHSCLPAWLDLLGRKRGAVRKPWKSTSPFHKSLLL